MLEIEDDVWHNMSENLSNEFVLEKKISLVFIFKLISCIQGQFQFVIEWIHD